MLEDSLARQSPTANTHAQLGEVYRQLKEFPKAKEQFEKAIQMDRSSSRAYYGLGQALVRLGANQEAEKVLAEFKRLKDSEKQAARKRRDDPAHHPEDKQIAPRLVAQILTLAAKVHFSHEEADIAEKHLRRAAKLVPNDTSCRQELADLYTTSGRLEEAVATVEDLRRIEPRNPVHLRTLGVLQARLRRWDAAEGTFRELCALAPDSAVGYAGLAESYLRTGKDLPEARTLAAKAVRLAPTAWNYFILAAICEKQGDREGAASALKTAIALEPNNPRYRQIQAATKGKD